MHDQTAAARNLAFAVAGWDICCGRAVRRWTKEGEVSSKPGFHRGRLVAVVCAVVLGGAVLPTSSLASTTFGADLSSTPDQAEGCGAISACTIITTASPAGAGVPLTSPIAGTIIRWRIKTAAGSSGTITFRVVASASGLFTGAGTGDTETAPTTTATTTFSTDLPIQAGEYVGVDASVGGSLSAFDTSQPGANAELFRPVLANGGAPAEGDNFSTFELLVNADVAALPTSIVTVPACSNTGQLAAVVKSDPDPAVKPKAIHFRIDGGSEQALATSDNGNDGSTTIPVPQGLHTLEYWGEDTVGGLESPHNKTSVLVDTIPPVVTITSDQGKATYALNEPASISTAASDSGTGLQTDPSEQDRLLPTSTPGTFTVKRTAVDRCGNATTASFTYTVLAPPKLTNVTQSNRRWREGKSRGITTGHVPVGTMFRFTLNESASVLFAFEQSSPGRTVNGDCVAPTRSNRGRPHCTRVVTRGTLSYQVGPGTHTLRFQGRLSKRKGLPNGRYTLVITATNPAGRSTTATLTFTIGTG